LQTERGKSRVTAANTNQEKSPRGGRHQPSPFRSGERVEKSDDEAAGDVDENGSPRKGFADAAGDKAGKPEAAHAAERAADCHPEICKHKNFLTEPIFY
jgi:hypothetical protein